jgi:hypothetical protein
MNRFKGFFPVSFCGVCSLKQIALSNNINIDCEFVCSYQFINFDTYKESLLINPTPPSCDLLFFDKQQVVFIEHKAKDLFYGNKKTAGQLKNNLEKKIQWSLGQLLKAIDCKDNNKTYCVLFSKQAIDDNKNIDSQYLKRYIRYSIFAQFLDYQENDNSFLFQDDNTTKKHKVFLIADECIKINEILK